MDTTESYRVTIKNVIEKYAQMCPSHGNIRLDVIFDENHDRYALMQTGWSQHHRVRGNLIYITLQDNKVYLEYDGIEHGISQDLLDAGIDSKDLVLAFLPEQTTLSQVA